MCFRSHSICTEQPIFANNLRLYTYIETLQRQAAPPTVKQHMAAIRMLFSWFTEKGVLAMNPAREVKTERFSRTEGKTPAFVEGEVQKLLDTIETSRPPALRDRALLGVLAYTFARIGAVVNLKVEDYYPSGKRFLLRFKEKGGKEKELPVHHKLEELLDQYLKASGLEKEPESPLFPASIGKTGKLSRRALVRTRSQSQPQLPPELGGVGEARESHHPRSEQQQRP